MILRKNRYQVGTSDTGEALPSPNNRPTIHNLNPNDENPALISIIMKDLSNLAGEGPFWTISEVFSALDPASIWF